MARDGLRRISRRVKYTLTGPGGYTTQVRVVERFKMSKYDMMVLKVLGAPGQERWWSSTVYHFVGPSSLTKKVKVVSSYSERGAGQRIVVRDFPRRRY
jgi:hypothetical protein